MKSIILNRKMKKSTVENMEKNVKPDDKIICSSNEVSIFGNRLRIFLVKLITKLINF